MSEATAKKTTRATTLQQRFGFQDPELTTPKHDAIMLWLDAEMDSIINPWYIDTEPLKWADQGAKLRARALEAMAKAVAESEEKTKAASETLSRFVSESSSRSDGKVAPGAEFFESRFESARKQRESLKAAMDCPLVPEWPGITVSKTWEQPVMNGKFMVGFVDMAVLAENPYLCLCNRSNGYPRDPWEFSVAAWERDPMGDGAPLWTTRSLQRSFLFEVKPSISSLGEVIRQIRMYEAYEENATFLVVCPDSRFQSPLAAQGIGFVQCPSF